MHCFTKIYRVFHIPAVIYFKFSLITQWRLKFSNNDLFITFNAELSTCCFNLLLLNLFCWSFTQDNCCFSFDIYVTDITFHWKMCANFLTISFVLLGNHQGFVDMLVGLAIPKLSKNKNNNPSSLFGVIFTLDLSCYQFHTTDRLVSMIFVKCVYMVCQLDFWRLKMIECRRS